MSFNDVRSNLLPVTCQRYTFAHLGSAGKRRSAMVALLAAFMMEEKVFLPSYDGLLGRAFFGSIVGLGQLTETCGFECFWSKAAIRSLAIAKWDVEPQMHRACEGNLAEIGTLGQLSYFCLSWLHFHCLCPWSLYVASFESLTTAMFIQFIRTLNVSDTPNSDYSLKASACFQVCNCMHWVYYWTTCFFRLWDWDCFKWTWNWMQVHVVTERPHKWKRDLLNSLNLVFGLVRMWPHDLWAQVPTAHNDLWASEAVTSWSLNAGANWIEGSLG